MNVVKDGVVRGIVEGLRQNHAVRHEFAQTNQQIASHACSEPAIAELVQALGAEFLIETLALSDGEFVDLYGHELDGIGDRFELRSRIQNHLDACRHCQLAEEQNQWLTAQVLDALPGTPIEHGKSHRLVSRTAQKGHNAHL